MPPGKKTQGKGNETDGSPLLPPTRLQDGEEEADRGTGVGKVVTVLARVVRHQRWSKSTGCFSIGTDTDDRVQRVVGVAPIDPHRENPPKSDFTGCPYNLREVQK